MPTCTLSFPGSPVAVMDANSAYAGAGAVSKQLLSSRVRTYGALPGQHVYDWAYDRITVAPGAPGTNNLDLMSLVTPDGSTLAGTVGKLVYLEIVQVTGEDDLAVRRSAANALALLTAEAAELSSITIKGGRAVLFDLLTPGTSNLVEGLDFNATNKMLQFESTVGCTFDILIAVI